MDKLHSQKRFATDVLVSVDGNGSTTKIPMDGNSDGAQNLGKS